MTLFNQTSWKHRKASISNFYCWFSVQMQQNTWRLFGDRWEDPSRKKKEREDATGKNCFPFREQLVSQTLAVSCLLWAQMPTLTAVNLPQLITAAVWALGGRLGSFFKSLTLNQLGPWSCGLIYSASPSHPPLGQWDQRKACLSEIGLILKRNS